MSRCACCGRPLGPGPVLCRNCVADGATIKGDDRVFRCRRYPHNQKRIMRTVVR